MPLPLLFIGLAVASSAAGVGKSVKAGVDQNQAKTINDDSNQRMTAAANHLDRCRKQCGDALEHLGQEKIFVLNGSIRSFLDAFEQIKNVDFSNSEGLEELNKLHIDRDSFDSLEKTENFVYSLATGSATGATGGALAAFGAYSAATTFATASTGASIATLSGIAAKNATLAFFGGGSLAAGGLGVAGGTAVLGGLVAGPALLIMGTIVGAKAGKNLEDAKANAAKADETCAQFGAGADQCIAIRRRTYMFYSLLARLDAYLAPLVCEMETILQNEGVDYSQYSDRSKKAVACAAAAAVSVKTVLDTPILTPDGSLTEDSEKAGNALLKDINRKEKG